MIVFMVVLVVGHSLPPHSHLIRDSPDESRIDLDGSDFLDCPEARMGGVDDNRHCEFPKWR
jgi:hypothetical protein